ncbi:MAG TPA: sulfatase-like hydrolase/transferase [Vicinamibacterales bacterium]|nr:sulfatase-like hydrolase/transferase [Vicinamibacterales bacterium]
MRRSWPFLVLFAIGVAACDRRPGPGATASTERPSVLLVTLDTTRADSIGPGAAEISTPVFNAIAAAGRQFRQAYATVPETLPSHASMMTGLYPAGHGVHENARVVPAGHELLAERLKAARYRTSAFVSSFVLARRFGLARGFDVYDDDLPDGSVERSASATTDRAIADLGMPSDQPRFVWVHYFDAHAPYAPPDPFAKTHAAAPYLGEIAYVDQQLGRLLDAFNRLSGPRAIVVVADHGEGLGEHGEAQHGHLLYQSTMHVPLVVSGPGVAVGADEQPVSIRRVFHTILDFAGLGDANSLRRPSTEAVLGEAMKPFLEYGWQPQVMALFGRRKAILTGTLELYDVAADPKETRNLASAETLSASERKTIEEYPVPAPGAPPATASLDPAAREKLASLGYVGATARPIVRRDAPRPVDMTAVLTMIEQASTLFVRERYAEVIPVLERILERDPQNLDAALRLATAHSSLGHDRQAVAAFDLAAAIAPRSADVKVYLALHYARGTEWPKAAPMLEAALADSPDRLPVMEALARIRERQGRDADATALWARVFTLRPPTAAEAIAAGTLSMRAGQTAAAIGFFETARRQQGAAFARDLELGVLYLADRQLTQARDALDRVPSTHPEYPMALFKRAQASVLLQEPDHAARIQRARDRADATTRSLIAKERLFQGK